MQPFWPTLGNLYAILPGPVVGVLGILLSALCGAAIGWDRERLKKPAGLTTMALICMGAAVYTQASLLMGSGEASDPSRIAAQIVTGIGFLGAGAILRDRGAVTGLTTAATIWAVAAVGIVLGSGHAAAGVVLTGLVFGILTGLKGLERRILGDCAFGGIDLDFDPQDGKAELALRQILDDYRVADAAFRFTPQPDGAMRLSVQHCHVHKHHRRFASDLAGHPSVMRVARSGGVATVAGLAVLALLLTALAPQPAGAVTKNGFDLNNARVPAAEILPGGPPRDGIPAIDRPVFVPAGEAGFLAADDRVLGLVHGKVAKAYPVRVLNWHEVVNDRFGDTPVVITYCPLCGTGVAFRARVDGRALRFGVSGLLYNSDVLLYDRQTQSLWSQLMTEAVSGPMAGARLTMLPLQHTTWADWRARHPETVVLSTRTGYRRDYGRDPYAGYGRRRSLYFPVRESDGRFHPKELVLGVELDGRFKAYPFSELNRSAPEVTDRVGDRVVTVVYDRAHRTARVFDGEGSEVAGVIAYWFAWYAFHPDTAVYRAP